MGKWQYWWLMAISMVLSHSPAAAQVFSFDVAARPIASFRVTSSQTQFGALEFVGGLELSAKEPHFGAFSAIRFVDQGKSFIGVADTGYWYKGQIERNSLGQPVGVSQFSMSPIRNTNSGVVVEKWKTDAEGLSLDGNQATVSFERVHRIEEFLTRSGTIPGKPTRNLPFLVPTFELRGNKGFETIVKAPHAGILAGARVIIAERSIDKAGNCFAAIIEGPGKGIFTVRRIGEFDITDGAFLPNGDLLILERQYSIASGVAMRIRKLNAASIGKGKIADGPILLEADLTHQIDNMEGLDVWVDHTGDVRVSLISDNNHSILQRNLYLEFKFARNQQPIVKSN